MSIFSSAYPTLMWLFYLQKLLPIWFSQFNYVLTKSTTGNMSMNITIFVSKPFLTPLLSLPLSLKSSYFLHRAFHSCKHQQICDVSYFTGFRDADAIIKCPECTLNAYDRKWWPSAFQLLHNYSGVDAGFNPCPVESTRTPAGIAS